MKIELNKYENNQASKMELQQHNLNYINSQNINITKENFENVKQQLMKYELIPNLNMLETANQNRWPSNSTTEFNQDNYH